MFFTLCVSLLMLMFLLPTKFVSGIMGPYPTTEAVLNNINVLTLLNRNEKNPLKSNRLVSKVHSCSHMFEVDPNMNHIAFCSVKPTCISWVRFVKDLQALESEMHVP